VGGPYASWLATIGRNKKTPGFLEAKLIMTTNKGDNGSDDIFILTDVLRELLGDFNGGVAQIDHSFNGSRLTMLTSCTDRGSSNCGGGSSTSLKVKTRGGDGHARGSDRDRGAIDAATPIAPDVTILFIVVVNGRLGNLFNKMEIGRISSIEGIKIIWSRIAVTKMLPSGDNEILHDARSLEAEVSTP